MVAARLGSAPEYLHRTATPSQAASRQNGIDVFVNRAGCLEAVYTDELAGEAQPCRAA